jgi:hypothetical protein
MTNIDMNRSEALIKYAELANAVEPLQSEIESLMVPVREKQAELAEVMEKVHEYVAMTGVDPFGLVKKAKGTRGPQGPRNPSRRVAVLRQFAEGPVTIRQVADALGEPTTYVSSVVNFGAKNNPEDWPREKADGRAYAYTFTGEVPEIEE